MKRKIRLQRGEPDNLRLDEFKIEVETGMVVLDAIHLIQATEAPDLAVRWNCKAGKCGSCSAEVNGEPKLTCMTRLSDYPEDQTLTVQPMKTFPLIKDLVNDVSWNYDMAERSNIHITPKPIKLLETIIKHTTDENDLLLDCFAGSGSLGMACKNTNRKCILIEKEKKYFDYINKSLNINNDL